MTAHHDCNPGRLSPTAAVVHSIPALLNVLQFALTTLHSYFNDILIAMVATAGAVVAAIIIAVVLAIVGTRAACALYS